MNILAINGSHRGTRGWTHFLTQQLFAGAIEAGAGCQEITLSRLKINRCLACQKCQTEEQHLTCVYRDKDDAKMVFEQMANADILIYATPIYLYNMTGLMKTFLDRLYGTGDVADMELSDYGLIHHDIDETVCSKPFVTLVVCANLEHETWKSVPAYFRTYARFMNARQVGVLVRDAVDLLGERDAPDLANPQVAIVLQAYEQAGRELATTGKIQWATQRRANRSILPLPFARALNPILTHVQPIKQKIVERAMETRQPKKR